MAAHDGVEAVVNLLRRELILVAVGGHIHQHPEAEVLGFLANPGKTVVLRRPHEVLADRQLKAEFLLDPVHQLHIPDVIESIDDALMLSLIDSLHDTVLVFAQEVAQRCLRLRLNAHHHLRRGPLVALDVHLVGVVGLQLAQDNIPVHAEHLCVMQRRDGDVHHVETGLGLWQAVLRLPENGVDEVAGHAVVLTLVGDKKHLEGLARGALLLQCFVLTSATGNKKHGSGDDNDELFHISVCLFFQE